MPFLKTYKLTSKFIFKIQKKNGSILEWFNINILLLLINKWYKITHFVCKNTLIRLLGKSHNGSI